MQCHNSKSWLSRQDSLSRKPRITDARATGNKWTTLFYARFAFNFQNFSVSASCVSLGEALGLFFKELGCSAKKLANGDPRRLPIVTRMDRSPSVSQ